MSIGGEKGLRELREVSTSLWKRVNDIVKINLEIVLKTSLNALNTLKSYSM